MTHLKRLWASVGLQTRLQALIQGSLIVILVLSQLWITDAFERQTLEGVKKRAIEVSNGAINGLNTLMITEMGGEEVIRDRVARKLFIQKMGESDRLLDLRVFRDKQLDSEFPKGMPEEEPVDDLDRYVLSTGTIQYKLQLAKARVASLRTVVPFIASSNFRNTNCLKCHSVAEGTVLGGASITIDIQEDLSNIERVNTLFWIFQLCLQVLLYFVIRAIVGRLAKSLGGEPTYVIDVVNKIAKGNLSQEISISSNDRSSLLAAVKKMQDDRRNAEDALNEKRALLSDVVTFLPDATLARDASGRIIIWNKAIETMTGVAAADMIGKSGYAYAIPFYGEAKPLLMDLIHLDSNSVVTHYPTFIREGESLATEVFCNALYNNRGAWVYAKSSPLHDQTGNVIGAIEIVRDISLQKLSEKKLQLAASVFTHAREAITITDINGNILDVNEMFTTITGYAPEDVRGKNPRILKSGRQKSRFYVDMWKSLNEHGHWNGEIWNRRKNGEVYPEMLTISAVRDAGGITQHYVALFSDITSIKEHENQLEHAAHYDALTGLPNRLLLADRLLQSILQAQRRRRPLAVVYIDLDGFKAVNDNHGHEAGDRLLIALASRLKLVLREGDTLARLGGDEFVAVLLDLANFQMSEPMLSRLLDAASAPIRAGDLQLKVSASLGVTFFPQVDEVDADQLLRQADQAMYQAKLAGKNRFHIFDAEQDRNVRGHHETLERIRHALVNHEFVLHYQPKVNMREGTLVGAEALIRWSHPENGLLLPSVFLPAIENHPLSIQLGEWVIDTALTQMEQWQKVGLDIAVSVNIGGRQLQDRDFLMNLKKCLAAHPTVSPTKLELEVLETSALEDMALVSQVIHDCREIGVKFALDDFGTGYSSLTYLKLLPVAQLKIDRSFVRDMLDDPDDLSILQGVLSLAKAFKRDVIAEGVETIDQGTLLMQLGCELAQGYGISRPMDGREMPNWAASWHGLPAWLLQSPLDVQDLPLLFAGVEHRAWVRSVEEYVKGERTIPPILDDKLCPFGKWLNDAGVARFGNTEAFTRIGIVHQEIHELAKQICLQHSSGGTVATDQLQLLHDQRCTILANLNTLMASQWFF